MISTGENNDIYYITKDHLGSITALIDEEGEIAEEYSYDSWGRRRNPITWNYLAAGLNPSQLITRGFTGHEHLDQFAIINMNGRLYDPVLGRMFSPDNFIQDASSSQSYNRYTYCNNNPLKYTDPSGNYYYLNPNTDKYEWVSFGGGSGIPSWSGLSGGPAAGSLGYTYLGNGNYMDRATGEWASESDYLNQDLIGTASNYEEAMVWLEGKMYDSNGNLLYVNLRPLEVKAKGVANGFYGADVRFVSDIWGASSYFAGAINTTLSTYTYYRQKGLSSPSGQHLMHEYGHYLQNKYGGSLWYNMAVVPTSLINYNTLDDKAYNNTWTEIQANTMSYYYFNYPSDWDFGDYPINPNYLSIDQQSQLYYHKP